MHQGQYKLEAHLNYVGLGTKVGEGPVAPFNNQALGLVTEFSFQRTTYEENSPRVEIRPMAA
jgi:hypothetical protein